MYITCCHASAIHEGTLAIRGYGPKSGITDGWWPMVPPSLQTSVEHSTIIDIANITIELLLEIGAYITLVDPHHRSLCLLAQPCDRFYSLLNSQIMDHIVDCILQALHYLDIEVKRQGVPKWRACPSPGFVEEAPEDIPYKRSHTSDIRCYRSLVFHARHIGSVTVDLRYGNLNFRALVCLLKNSCIQRPGIELNITEASILSSWGSQYVAGPFVFTFDSTRKAVPLPCCKTKRVDSKRP